MGNGPEKNFNAKEERKVCDTVVILVCFVTYAAMAKYLSSCLMGYTSIKRLK